MPPRIAQPAERSPSPLLTDDAQDILIIQDIMDTMDQIPPELTRVHSDLNELGAVLYSTLLNLEKKLNQLINWVQDASIPPEKRFELLQEIAEEAARYKLGGDDKIRVAGGACDGLMAHQRHINNLISSSTLLNPAPPSPYTHTLTLAQLPLNGTSRRGLTRAVNSPFGGPAGRTNVPPGPSGLGTGNGERDTPTKKKKSRMNQVGGIDDDNISVSGEKKKAPIKKRKPVNRATSPADSLASGMAGKPAPTTARQIAAAMSRAKKAERADDSDEESEDGEKGALGLDMGSREGSHLGDRSLNATPTLANGTVASLDKRNRSRGIKRSRAGEDDEEEDMSDFEDEEGRMKKADPKKPKPAVTTAASVAGSTNGAKRVAGVKGAGWENWDEGEVEVMDNDGVEVDSKVYCTCRQVSYGEMIGCDDDDCEIEWYHLQCLNLDKTPEGNWICPQCVERRKRNPKKKAGKSRAKK